MGKPSRMRREGREAFHPGEHPEMLCPYINDWNKRCWMDGWEEEKEAYNHKEKVKKLEDEKWEGMSWSCPWFKDAICEANSKSCEKENCAPYYFKEEG